MQGQEYEQLTLFQEGSPASRSVCPGDAEARTMTVTSGLKCLELSKNSGPLGLLVKMLLASSVWHSTRCFLTWKIKATKQGHLLYQLAVSMPRIEGTASPLWHTPNVPNGGRVNPLEMSQTGRMPDGKKRQVGLEHQVRMVERGLWPTPTQRDHKGANSMEHLCREGMKNHRGQLANAVKLVPTPKAQNAFGAGQRHGDGGPSLDVVVGGQLNPSWVEWLMGFPIGWTDLNASETP